MDTDTVPHCVAALSIPSSRSRITSPGHTTSCFVLKYSTKACRVDGRNPLLCSSAILCQLCALTPGAPNVSHRDHCAVYRTLFTLIFWLIPIKETKVKDHVKFRIPLVFTMNSRGVSTPPPPPPPPPTIVTPSTYKPPAPSLDTLEGEEMNSCSFVHEPCRRNNTLIILNFENVKLFLSMWYLLASKITN